MKLFYTGNSPYARRPRIAVREAGLMDKVEEIDIAPREEHGHLLMEQGPGGKVPGLLTDDGAYLCESIIITHYLDELAGGKLLPKAGAERAAALQIEGLASLLMDSLFVRARENRRDPSEQSPGVIEIEANRAARTYDALNESVPSFDGAIHLGTIAGVSALGYADWRHPGDNWRNGRSALADWFERMMQRPAMAETKPIF
ncbi:MAG: glutathione S-transferase N-terminal domain-containing protein [Alphaproteobacteria bacterium]|nr:glutathione S-transferase N-terminal domain-containing protein [Alphaproteobacteria bacterium]